MLLTKEGREQQGVWALPRELEHEEDDGAWLELCLLAGGGSLGPAGQGVAGLVQDLCSSMAGTEQV